MGRKIVLTGTTLTDTNAPRLTIIDPIESAGSMLLIEPMHPSQQWAAGTPATGAVIPNLLNGMLGTGDATLDIAGSVTNGVRGILERSGKGGLHGIISQAETLPSGSGIKIAPSPALFAYVYANLGHEYYISAWDRLTRVNPDAAASPTRDYSTASTTGTGIAHAAPATWNIPSSILLGSRVLGNALGGRFANVAVGAAVMANSSAMNGTALPVWAGAALTYNQSVLATRNGKWPSFVFYRVYIEDLTVSGRTYAQVDAIDYALYTKEVLTPGGRYYGDTFTDPATLP